MTDGPDRLPQGKRRTWKHSIRRGVMRTIHLGRITLRVSQFGLEIERPDGVDPVLGEGKRLTPKQRKR